MTQLGVVGIDSVEAVNEDEVTEQDATDAGFASRDELLAHLSYRDDDIYRIKVHFAGEDPRKALREQADLSETSLARSSRSSESSTPTASGAIGPKNTFSSFMTVRQPTPASLPDRSASKYLNSSPGSAS